MNRESARDRVGVPGGNGQPRERVARRERVTVNGPAPAGLCHTLHSGNGLQAPDHSIIRFRLHARIPGCTRMPFNLGQLKEVRGVSNLSTLVPVS